MAKSILNGATRAASTPSNTQELYKGQDAGPVRNTHFTGNSFSSRSSLPRPVFNYDKPKGTHNVTLPRSKIPNMSTGKHAVSRENSAGTLKTSSMTPGNSYRRSSGTADSNAVNSRTSAGTVRVLAVTQQGNLGPRAQPSNTRMPAPRKGSAGELGSPAVTVQGSAGILKTTSLPRRNVPKVDAGTAQSPTVSVQGSVGILKTTSLPRRNVPKADAGTAQSTMTSAVPLKPANTALRVANIILQEKSPGRIQQPTMTSKICSVPARGSVGPPKEHAGMQNSFDRTLPKTTIQRGKEVRPQRSLSGLGKSSVATVNSAGSLKPTLANKTQFDCSRRTQQRTLSNLSEPTILPVVCVYSEKNELLKKERFSTPERTAIPKLMPSKNNNIRKDSPVNPAFCGNRDGRTAKTATLPASLQANGSTKTCSKTSSKIPRLPERKESAPRIRRLPQALDAGVKDSGGTGIPHVSSTRKPSLDSITNSRSADLSDPAGTGPTDLGYVSEKEKSPDEDDNDEEFLFDDIAEKYGSCGGDDDLLIEAAALDTKRILDKLLNMLPKDDLIKVTIDKTSQGLGFSISGGFASGTNTGATASAIMESLNIHWDGFVRVKKIFPHGAAWQSGQLQPGDVLLSANGVPLSGLSHTEALEVLRCCPRQTDLLLYRNPSAIRQADTLEMIPQPVIKTQWLSPAYPLSALGEFEVVLTKVNGSLGFTLRKEDESVLGHYVRALVKEPALTDGRIRAGDKIVSVNNVDISSMTHSAAIAFLRRCPDTVTIRLFRDSALSPLSPLSPVEPEVSLQRPRPVLRREAQDLLQDLAARKQQLGSSGGSTASTSSFGSNTLPRRKRLTKTTSPDLLSVVRDRYGSLGESSWTACGPIVSSPPMSPLPELDTEAAAESKTSPRCSRKEPDAVDSETARESSASSDCRSRTPRPNSLDLSNKSSLKKQLFLFTPPGDNSSRESGINGSSSEVFPGSSSSSTSTPVYQETRCDCATGLMKWKGVTMSDDLDGVPNEPHDEPILTVELNKGWSSRLGFSVGLSPHGKLCITAIYDDSVAAKDGRLQVGDHVLRVNGENVSNRTKEDVIDLLRKTRGPVSVTVRKIR